MRVLSRNPARRSVERYWLAYTLVWGSAAGAVMLSGLAERWGDVELMVFGVVLALGAVVPPVLRPHPSENRVPIHRRVALKLGLSVVGFAFLWNYFCTPYFFDVLHMHYGFRTRWNLRNNPLFLYFLTIAYFATYAVLVGIVTRAAASLRVRWHRLLTTSVAPFGVAFLETALNANPFIARLYCYDELGFMLWFGTLSYGVCFVGALPVWRAIDDEPGTSRPLERVVVDVLGATMAILVVLAVLRHVVAPSLTTVIEGAPGLRDYGESCLGTAPPGP